MKEDAFLSEICTYQLLIILVVLSITVTTQFLISLVRRAMPNLIAYDVCSVQPMTGPTGLIFAMKSRETQGGTEALFNEPDAWFLK